MNLESFILDLQKKSSPGIGGKVILSGLELLAKVYKRGVICKREKALKSRIKLDVPVVSVGNITAGGTGKTPCIIELAEQMKACGIHPAVLSRGYKSGFEKEGGIVSDGKKIVAAQKMAGDEPYMMAFRLPGVPVLVGRDRILSAKKAIELGADILLLDDGLQYWPLKHDLEIVLVDCTNPFGYGHMLPRGLLREPLDGLARADLFVLTKSNQVDDKTKDEITEKLHKYGGDIPVLESDHVPSALTSFSDWKKQRICNVLEQRQGAKVLLLSGIGNPGAFWKTSEKAGLCPVEHITFKDHYSYSNEDIKKVFQKLKYTDAEILVITEKDAVKMIDLQGLKNSEIPVYVLSIKMEYSEHDRQILQSAWEKLL